MNVEQDNTINKTGLTTSGVGDDLVAVGAGDDTLGVAENNANTLAT